MSSFVANSTILEVNTEISFKQPFTLLTKGITEEYLKYPVLRSLLCASVNVTSETSLNISFNS